MDTQQSELEVQMEASLTGRIVPRFELPREADCIAVHAQLARVCRESRRFAMVEVKGEEDGE